MADLANPTVNARYACGCSFSDTIELGGTRQYTFSGDETEMFRVTKQLDSKSLAQRRAILVSVLDEIADDFKPTRAQLETLTADEVYEKLLRRDASEVAEVVADGVRFPEPPSACPRHGAPMEYIHTSYLNPAAPAKEQPVVDIPKEVGVA